MRTWGESGLNGDDYIGRDSRHPDSAIVKLMAKKGELHGWVLPYTWAWHLALLLGVVLSCLFSLANRSYRVLFALVAIVGVYLFMSVWECNARYLLPFVPVLLLAAADGWFALRGKRS